MDNLNISPFVLIEDGEVLIPVLQSRYPRDSHIYNTVLAYQKLREILRIYTLGKLINDDTWIVTLCDRQDYGRVISISCPTNPKITPELKEVFRKSRLFDWSKSYSFVFLELSVSDMILEISLRDYGNETTISPCNFYYMDFKDAQDMMLREPEPGTSLKSLDTDSGADFLFKTWKYSRESSLPYFKNLIQKLPSQGVFVGDKIISGLAISTNGTMGFLYTEKEHRNKSFGSLAMQGLIKEQIKLGFIPCSTVEKHNLASDSFHKKVGLKFSYSVDVVFYFENTTESSAVLSVK